MTRLMRLVELVSKISYMRSKVANDGYGLIMSHEDQYKLWEHWLNRERNVINTINEEYERKM